MPAQGAPDPGQECTSCSLRILKHMHKITQLGMGSCPRPDGTTKWTSLMSTACLRSTQGNRKISTEKTHGPTYLVDSLLLVQL